MARYLISFIEKEPDFGPAGKVYKIGIKGEGAQVERRFAYALAHYSPFRRENVSVIGAVEVAGP